MSKSKSKPGTDKATLKRFAALVEDRYAIEDEIGRGGMAIVYLARDLRHDRSVALKLIQPELTTASTAERFLQEIQITASLQHPHILPLLDSGVADDLLYYVMPHVEGESLRDRLKHDPPLTIEEALGITRQVASALQYAHDNGVIHRDIKPENILLSAGIAVLADFGIAKAVYDGPPEGMTVAGFTLGTPAYMSPEQATGAELDARADQYSLACVLFEMATGKPPFLADTVTTIIRLKLTEPTPSVTALRPELPEELDAILHRALAKEPEDRFESVGQLAQALESLAGPVIEVTGAKGSAEAAGVSVRQTAPAIQGGDTVRRVLVVGGIIAILIIIGLYLFDPSPPRPNPVAPVDSSSTAAADSTTATASDMASDAIEAGPVRAMVLEVAEGDTTGAKLATGLLEELARRTEPALRLLVPGARSGSAADTTATTLTGSVLGRGPDLKLSLRLSRPGDRVIVWAEDFVFPAGEVGAIRTAMIEKAARALTARLGAR